MALFNSSSHLELQVALPSFHDCADGRKSRSRGTIFNQSRLSLEMRFEKLISPRFFYLCRKKLRKNLLPEDGRVTTRLPKPVMLHATVQGSNLERLAPSCNLGRVRPTVGTSMEKYGLSKIV